MAHTRWRHAWSTLPGIALIAGLVFAPTAASASGGGGCGRRVTDAPGTTVTIRQFCFGPTILRVAPGETVTWINKDTSPHTVVGANAVWGDFSTLRRTARVTYRFVRPGVYPYVCTYHPGMVGAVVVGDAAGPGAAGAITTEAGPVTLVDPSAELRQTSVALGRPVNSAAGLDPWLAGVGIAFVLSSIAGAVWIRMRRHRIATAH